MTELKRLYRCIRIDELCNDAAANQYSLQLPVFAKLPRYDHFLRELLKIVTRGERNLPGTITSVSTFILDSWTNCMRRLHICISLHRCTLLIRF